MPLIGAADLREKITAFKTNARGALGAALYEEAVEIIGASDKDVPYEFGHLRGSHFVEAPTQESSGPAVELGYGAGYGLYVHEIPANHPKGGKDHFLRDNFNAALSGMPERIAARTQAHLDAGTGYASAGVPSVRPNPMDAINADKADRTRARGRARAASIRAQNAARRRGGR